MTDYDPVETNTPNVNGHPITIWVTATASQVETVSLPADAPKIDLRIEDPVLSMIFFSTAADANSEAFDLSSQIARGETPNDVKEWCIATLDTISLMKSVAAANAGFIGITYIAFGAQQT